MFDRRRGAGPSLKSIFLLAIGIIFLLAVTGASLLVLPLWHDYRHAHRMLALDSQLGSATVALARERGMISTALAAADPAATRTVEEIAAVQRQADAMIGNALSSLSRLGDGLRVQLARVQQARSRVLELRSGADSLLRQPDDRRDQTFGAAWIAGATELIEACQALRLAAMRTTNAAETTFEDLQTLQHFAWAAAEHAGRERARLGALISAGEPIGEAALADLHRNRGELQFAWEMSTFLADLVAGVPEVHSAAAVAARRYFVEFDRLRSSIMAAGRAGKRYPVDAQAWLRESTAAIDSLLAVQSAAAEAAAQYRNAAFARAVSAILLGAGLFVAAAAIATAALFLLRRRVIDPLRQLTLAARRFARGDFAAAIPGSGATPEIAEMTIAVEEIRNDALARARLEAELRQARDRAEAANLAKTQFLANISHELRTPLNAIIGFSELISTEALGPLGQDKYRDYARDVNQSGYHLLAIVNDLLDMSRIEAKQVALAEDEVDLAEIAEVCLRRVEDQARAADLHLEYDPVRLESVRADQRRIAQIITNLLSNAVKFTPAGGRVCLRLRATPRGEAVIEVEDTGIGMRQSDLALVFEPFRQVDQGLARRYEGTGLGLSLSKAIAELHGGRLELESALGVGTTVRLILPAERRFGAAMPAAERAASA
ncbi:MAG: hypothetical protein BroJett029_24870 [Alphaproteobacteria bacterium]|nr:MAG: hypothetical protein BroJett029_24870 [Alphaproteobacteria bacterium]